MSNSREMVGYFNEDLKKVKENIEELGKLTQLNIELTQLVNELTREFKRDELRLQSAKIRQKLFDLRAHLYQVPLLSQIGDDQHKTELHKQAKQAVHETLCDLTRIFPLNPRDEDHDLICPLSRETVERRAVYQEYLLVASNGYIYRLSEIEKGAYKTWAKPHFTQPPEGNFSQEDIDAIHQQGKSNRKLRGIFTTAASTIFSFAAFYMLTSAAATLAPALFSSVFSYLAVGLALGAGLAAAVMWLPIVVPSLVMLIACGVIAYKAIKSYDATYSSQLAPVSAAPSLASTAVSFDLLDAKPTEAPEQLVELRVINEDRSQLGSIAPVSSLQPLEKSADEVDLTRDLQTKLI